MGKSIAESSISVLVMESVFLRIEPFINPSALPVIVLGEVSEKRPHYHTYKEFIEGAEIVNCPPAEYVENKCAVIINSSGTTGVPKPIELGDSALNSAVHKLVSFGLNLTGSNMMLKNIPSHIGMGLITTLYTCLITGDILVFFPENSPQESTECGLKKIIEFPNFVRENSFPNGTKLLLFAFPMFFRALLQFSNNLTDMSFIGCMLAAGSAMSREELEKMDAVFSEKGCEVPVLNGYGQNEMAGGVTMTGIHDNKRGSAGKPMVDTEIRVVDMNTLAPLPNNSIGKILERSNSLFIGYENMPERTISSFITDENGDTWFDTNDLGYIDDDGFLFITGRTSRVIIRFDVKVLLQTIEDKIRMSKYIKDAGVIAVRDYPYDTPVAFVILKDEYIGANIVPDMIIDEIQSGSNSLNDFEMVGKLFIVDALPYLSSGKIDYRALEKMAEEAAR